jgi:hypothetical protein
LRVFEAALARNIARETIHAMRFLLDCSSKIVIAIFIGAHFVVA